MRDAWSNERIELLKSLWREGRTAAAIGAALGGMSRSAVLGKVFRLRLGPAGEPQLRQPNQDASPDGSPSRRRSAQRRKQCAPTQAQPKTRGKSLLELTNASCRWPHGRPGTINFHFCGAASADLERGIPYCAQHMARAYAGSEHSPESHPLIPAVSVLTGAWTNGIPQRRRSNAGRGRSARS
jgi:GcrA cell cycle regulator